MAEGAVLIEASWEVAHKDGGIYTVLTTKLDHARSHFAGRYFPVGAYRTPVQDFLEAETVPEEWRGIAANLEKLGIGLHYGTWQLPGKPEVILLDWRGLLPKLDEIKRAFWDDFQLDTLDAAGDTDEPLAWSAAVGHFVAEYKAAHPDTPVVLHAHEWLAAGAILMAKHRGAQFSSVFTTHATVLGRALSSDGEFIYDKLETYDPDQVAKDKKLTAKHQLERLGGTQSDVFTTVSTVTARETAAFLGRAAAVVENGIDGTLFPTYDEITVRRPAIREQIDSFVSAYFFPSYRFSLADTRYVFTMGRYEFRNKGYDLTLEALAALNNQLKEEKSAQTLIAFFFVPGDSVRLRPEVAKQLVTYRHLRTLLDSFAAGEHQRIEREIWDDVACAPNLMPEAAQDQARRYLDQVRTNDDPLTTPFELRHPEQDAILQNAARLGLKNRKEDRVKLLLFPVYLDGFDGAFNLPLYDLVSGCDLGVFASLYEPWGYTPVESVTLGVPAVTSTLAGFGQAVKTNPGVLVLNRDNGDFEKERDQLVAMLRLPLTELPRAWVARRLAAYQCASQFEWAVLYPKYLAAYKAAQE